MSTVCPAAGLGGLLNDNVLHQELVDGDVLGVGVGLGVLEEAKNVLDRLGGPAT